MQVGIDMGVASGGSAARLDIEELLATRLLVQGNSGSGKSHLLRRLLEQSAQWVQQVVIDPEGDFVTLSDKFGHVVVDGERSEAELIGIATRIRQHRVSCVLTLEGLEIDQQMRAASIFLNALFDADRDFWFPVLVVVDEASMVDLATMHSLLRRMPDGSRLLLVGDEAQLPPVGFGLIFHRLVEDPAISSRLTAVHRQAAATGIPAASAAMRSLGLPELPAYAGRHDGVSILPCTTADLAETVERVVIEIAESIGDTLVVTATHGGPAGVTALNERLQEASYRRSGVAPIRGMLGRFFAAGEPVIYGRNDYRQGLFNGMMGRVAETCPDDGTLTVLFDGETEARLLEREQLLDLQLAYAVTCHKCQGSSAPRIVVPLYGSRILEPSWLYTAVTRAERQIVFVGSVDVLAKALERPRAADRRRIGFTWPA